MSQLLFPLDLPRVPVTRGRGRPRTVPAKTLDDLRLAWTRVHQALDARSHLMARDLAWSAADALRRAAAVDLAALVENGLASGIGHPSNLEELLDRIDARMLGRAIRE